MLVDGIPDTLCLAHGYTETGTVIVVLFTSEMVEPVEKHFVAAHLVQVSARHYPAIQCCVLSAAIQCCVLSVCVPVRVLPCAASTGRLPQTREGATCGVRTRANIAINGRAFAFDG